MSLLDSTEKRGALVVAALDTYAAQCRRDARSRSLTGPEHKDTRAGFRRVAKDADRLADAIRHGDFEVAHPFDTNKGDT